MIRIGSLFTGIAGLDRGVELALARLGQPARVEWQAERDPYARAVLRKHYPTTPCFEDVHNVDGDAPPIDLLEGGFPCQDLSLAGKRAGISGARSNLWLEFERGIRVLRPDLVFVENVPELSAYLGHVLGPLAELGFDAEWGLFSAAEVGAPHRRERMFILAYARGYRFADPQQQVAGVGEPSAGAGNDGRARHVAHAESVGLRHRECCEGRARTGERGGENARTRPAGLCCNVRWWEAEPDVGRVVDGVSSRLDARRRRARLRCLGNGVVAEQAALAFVTLAQRAGLVAA